MKSKIKKELIEWILLISVAGIIYLGGWHTTIIGKIQQGILATGIIRPDTPEEKKYANYDFDLESLDGESNSFSSFKGEVIFVNFWATWCPPCIAEMPDIHQLYQEKNQQISFIMISVDDNEEKAKDFIEKKQFDFPVYFLRSSLPDSYDIHSIPTTYVIDKNGMIHIENHGMAKYNTDSFKELLSDLATN
ncbi:TlpA family protein disulfide reductase [Ekhidna sp.]|uniref:TlpA family protein disulfide reductase n=1 Tax=Ekhidna sp. TaxID=2608089 RepID=UPI003CCBB84C